MGYDLVLLGRAGDTPIDVEGIERRLATIEYERVRRSLGDVGFRSAVDLFGTYVGGASNLAGWLEDARLNTDRNLRLQYLAGEGLNTYEADAILRRMTASGIEFPEDLFSGSPELLEQLRRRIQRNAARD
jgi:spermidine synthase